MQSSPHLERARHLIAQDRWDLAEQELRLALVDDPQNYFAHALLSLCLTEREQFAEATSAAEMSVHLAPDDAFPHYVLSRALFARNHFPEAEAAVREALRLDPFDADYFGWLAQLCFVQRRWQETLDATEHGLSQDGQHVTCLNLRAMAQVKLGLKQDAGATIAAALERNPDNADTHANLGWTLLEQRQAKPAMEHFREALRLEPNLEWARQGIVEAMKAKFLIYRLMLTFFLWMMKLSRRAQWWVLLGGYFGYQFLRSVARQNPDLAPWLTPLIVAYVIFAVMTWLATPLFNLVLRLSRFGRLALSREEIRTSDWVGASLLGCVLLFLGYLTLGRFYLPFAAMMCGLLSFPLSRIYDCDDGWPRKTLIICTAGMSLLALVATAFMMIADHLASGDPQDILAGLGVLGFYAFCIAALCMQFAIIALVQATVRR